MVFVTGGTGLVGSHLIQELTRLGIPVKSLYRNSVPGIASSEKVQWVNGDILDVIALEEAMEGVDEVYHCAGVVSYNPKRRREMFKINVEGTANVVNACLSMGVKKLCHVSSVAALGRVKNTAINETLQWSEETNKSNYSKSKHLSEIEVWRGMSEGLKAVIVNPSIILGEGDWNKGSTAVFRSAYNEFPWYTEGVTGFVDVKDVVNAMIQLMRSDITQQRFILSEGNHPYKQVFTIMAEAFGKKPPYKQVTPFIASLVWRVEALKAMFSDKDPLLTRETANAAQAINHFDNSKLEKHLPEFSYKPLRETIERVCRALNTSSTPSAPVKPVV